MAELASWTGHKVVTAGKIISFGQTFRDPVTVEDVDAEPVLIDAPETLLGRERAQVGDYIVVYDDGTKSWSPAAVFEAGYTVNP